MQRTISPAISFFQFWPLCWFYEKPERDLSSREFKYFYSNGSTNSRVGVTRDGLFVVDLSNIEKAGEFEIDISTPSNGLENHRVREFLEKRSKIVNCLRSVVISNVLVEQGISIEIQAPITMVNIESCASIRDPLNIRVENGQRELLIEKMTMSHAMNKFDCIIENNTYLDMCNLLYKSHWEFTQANFTNTLIESWTVIEKVLNLIWERYLGERKREGMDVSSGRKTRLVESSAFNAHVLSEVMSLTGNLSHDQYMALSRIRKIRNQWMHNMKSSTHDEAAEALELADDMFSKILGFEFQLPKSVSFSLLTVTST